MKRKIFVKFLSAVIAFALIFVVVAPLCSVAAPVTVFEEDIVPVNKNANQTCKNFYRYLCNVKKSGNVISGAVCNRVIGINGTVADGENDYHQFIKDLFGVTPVIMGNHLGYKNVPDEDIAVLAQRYQKGAIPMFQFSAGDSSMLGDDRDNGIVNFDKTNPDRNTDMYQSYLDDRKAMGEFCKRMENAGIKVYILRLDIECNNSSKKGFFGTNYIGYDAFKRVWRDTVEYLSNEAKLTGALFAYAPAGFKTSQEYYPGADVVDINCPTVYANASDGEIFTASDCVDYAWMKDENRPFGFSELAARSVLQPGATRPIGDYADTLDTMLHCFPEVSFFALWYENVFSIEPTTGSSTIGNYNGEYFIKNPKVIVAENALDYRSSTPMKSNGIATLYTSNGTGTALELGNYSAASLKQKGITLSKTDSLDVLFGCAVAVYTTDDCSGDAAKVYFGKTLNTSGDLSKAKSLSVIKLENLALDKDVWSDNDDSAVFKVNNGKNDKYITESTNADGSLDITVDLGDSFVFGGVSLNLAGFYEDTLYNVREFAVYVSNNDVKYKMVYRRAANTDSSVNAYFETVKARYVKLKILKPNSSKSEIESKRVSIADFMVFGSSGLSLSGAIADDDTYGFSGVAESSGDTDIGYTSDDYGESMTTGDTGSASAKKPNIPKHEIPGFYNYLWILVCAAVLLPAGILWLVMLLLSKRKHRNKKTKP